MKDQLRFSISLLLGAVLACACQPSEEPDGSGVAADVAFGNVNVVPMDSELVLTDQTVLIRGDRIVAIGPAESTPVPADALNISGEGRYLMPGLAEMHGHIPAPTQPQQFTEDVLFLYVANGVTTVRGMQGAEGQLALRDRVNAGEIVGPNLYLAGPAFNGSNSPTAEVASQRVRDQQATGWHLMKVQGGLSVATYDAMAQTAHEVGIRFGGHVPADVGLVHAITQGQETIEHLDGYVEYLADADGNIDEGQLQDIVGRTREAGAWVVPTMALWETLRGALDLDTVQSYQEAQYMPPDMVEQWTERVESVHSNPDFSADAARQLIDNRMRILSALHEGGAGILLGTDAPQVFSVPGFSIHREMERMIAAGMTPYEVIQSGTRKVGEYFSNEDDFGTIAVGQRADLILVEGNPLEGVANVTRRAGVMVRGTFIPEANIQERLATIAASY